MTWRLTPSDRFSKAITKLYRKDPVTVRRIVKALDELASLDDPTTRCKALSGLLTGLWRLHIGDWRVICDIRRSELVIVALDVGHRSSIYD